MICVIYVLLLGIVFTYLVSLQDVAAQGVLYLCNFVNGKRMKMPGVLQVRTSGCLNT